MTHRGKLINLCAHKWPVKIKSTFSRFLDLQGDLNMMKRFYQANHSWLYSDSSSGQWSLVLTKRSSASRNETGSRQVYRDIESSAHEHCYPLSGRWFCLPYWTGGCDYMENFQPVKPGSWPNERTRLSCIHKVDFVSFNQQAEITP